MVLIALLPVYIVYNEITALELLWWSNCIGIPQSIKTKKHAKTNGVTAQMAYPNKIAEQNNEVLPMKKSLNMMHRNAMTIGRTFVVVEHLILHKYESINHFITQIAAVVIYTAILILFSFIAQNCINGLLLDDNHHNFRWICVHPSFVT